MIEEIRVSKIKCLKGSMKIPGDKSISHRSIMLGSIARGKTVINNFLSSEDCIATMNCFKQTGVKIKHKNNNVIVYGKGLYGLKKPEKILDAGNSGTTMRLMLGILAGQPFTSTITGDKSLRKRPMLRVVNPLRTMGAGIKGKNGGNLAPITVKGGNLTPVNFRSKVASAQVKSSILLAGLYAYGRTCVAEPVKSRDHTERMLKYFKGNIKVSGLKVCVTGKKQISGKTINVPGDISSAAFFIVAGLIVPDSKIKLLNVGINPTRTGILDVLKKMGANIKIVNVKNLEFEPAADIIVRTSRLRAVTISGKIIPRLIDEIPVLAVAASRAKGRTVFKDIGELRVKESDRIFTLCRELRKFGVKVKELKDGIIVYGKSRSAGCTTISYGDHRIAMAMAILGLVSEGVTKIKDTACIKTSFPDFEKILKNCSDFTDYKR